MFNAHLTVGSLPPKAALHAGVSSSPAVDMILSPRISGTQNGGTHLYKLYVRLM